MDKDKLEKVILVLVNEIILLKKRKPLYDSCDESRLSLKLKALNFSMSIPKMSHLDG